MNNFLIITIKCIDSDKNYDKDILIFQLKYIILTCSITNVSNAIYTRENTKDGQAPNIVLQRK